MVVNLLSDTLSSQPSRRIQFEPLQRGCHFLVVRTTTRSKHDVCTGNCVSLVHELPLVCPKRQR